jgi:hypothetical protein
MDSNETGAAGVGTRRVAVITLELDLLTLQLAIKDDTPGLELSLAMLRMAEDEYKRNIGKVWLEAHTPRVLSTAAIDAHGPRGS